MNTLNRYTAEYLSYCEYRKRLNFKTLKAYRIDLNQYSVFCNSSMDFLSRNTLDLYITELHKHYKPKSVKRKIASLKAFFHYLEYADLLVQNPFDKLDVHFREAKLLPKTIPFHSIQKFLSVLYAQKNQAASTYQLRCCLRDIAVIELLFATGMRISELCSLRPSDIDLENNTVLIYGKGAKERILQLGNPEVISALMLYQDSFKADISDCGYFFVNKQKHKLSDQSVRYDQPLCRSCRNRTAYYSPYVPTLLCYSVAGTGCRHPLYSENAWTQFYQHDRNLYPCVQR